MIWSSWWWKCFLACSQLLSSVCPGVAESSLIQTQRCHLVCLFSDGNLSVVLHIRVWVFCTDRICFVLALHIFPALRAVFCFWPRYVVIWSGLATLIAPMGTICTTSIQQTSNMMTNMFFDLFALFILFKISQKYCLESQSPGINGSVRSDLWLSDQVIESYIAAGQYVPWELRYTFSKDIVVKLYVEIEWHIGQYMHGN